jgi:hypothetical protein
VVRENEELKNWKLVYEAGHGLQELARNQKALKDENRRRAVEKEQLLTQVGALMDANSVLTHAFEKLKAEAGKEAGFHYPELQLQSEVQSLTVSLKAQIVELEAQVNALENENMRIRKALQHQAAAVGEQGFQFAGMSAEMIMRVNEFAAGLREGAVEMPPQPSDLMKDNRRLRDELQVMQIKLQNYEREIGGSLLGGGDWQMYLAAQVKLLQQQQPLPVESPEKLQLMEDLRRITAENAELHSKMAAWQAEMLEVLAAQRAQAMTVTVPVAAAAADSLQQQQLTELMMKHNEKLLSELQALKRNVVAADLPPTGRTPLNSTRRGGGGGLALDLTPIATNFNFNHTIGTGTGQMNMWTPLAGTRRDLNASLTLGGGGGGGGPQTPHGKKLLNQTIQQLNLPPEEWALDIRDLYSQLVECLEQLYEREQELEDTRSGLQAMEESLVAVRQQTAALYLEFAQRSDQWEAARRQLEAEHQSLLEERDGLRLKLKRTQEVTQLLERQDGGGGSEAVLEGRVIELTRKVAVFEVNEAVLSRRFIAQSEQLKAEQESRQRVEADFVEMEVSVITILNDS